MVIRENKEEYVLIIENPLNEYGQFEKSENIKNMIFKKLNEIEVEIPCVKSWNAQESYKICDEGENL